eukprot:scaffold19107_cov23-Tisochrysis_lutea.AAC.2
MEHEPRIEAFYESESDVGRCVRSRGGTEMTGAGRHTSARPTTAINHSARVSGMIGLRAPDGVGV